MGVLNTVNSEAKTSKKKSSLPWIILVIVVIIAVAVEGFILFNKGRNEAKKEPVDATDTMTSEEMLEEYRGLYPELTDDEILDLFNRETTDEERQLYEDITTNNDDLPPVAEIVDSTETGYIYKDADGNEHEVVDPFLNMTDEEAKEYSDKYSDITAFIPDNNQASSEQDEITGYPSDNTEEPFDGEDDLSLVDEDSKNGYSGAVIEREIPENGKGSPSKEDTYAPPSYEIVG